MLLHIIQREIHDHFASLRFALTTILVSLLMILNALIFAGSDYEQRLSEYSENTAWAASKVRTSCEHLNELATTGPVSLYKRPNSLAFCANAQEDLLPIRIQAATHFSSSTGGSDPTRKYRYNWPWRLNYVQETYHKNSMLQSFTALDWSFIIGVVMSFVAILFTFDAISGERERGTLKLILSNSVPRAVLLSGKFLGIFIAVAIPMLMGMILNLLIVTISGAVPVDGNSWARIGMMMAISFVYVSVFIGLGLAISSRMRHSSTSLLALLLIWVILVVLVPNTLGSVVSILRRVPSQREFSQQHKAAADAIEDNGDRFKYGSPTQPDPDRRAVELWAASITKRLDLDTRMADEHLAAQFGQVRLARQILRVSSPTVIYNYAMESLAGTGFARHRQFVETAQRYRSQFVDFIKTTDRGDSNSFHVYYLKEGLSSKPVDFDSVPRFIEPVGAGVAGKNALMDLSLIIVFSVLCFMACHLAFLRCDVR